MGLYLAWVDLIQVIVDFLQFFAIVGMEIATARRCGKVGRSRSGRRRQNRRAVTSAGCGKARRRL